VMAHAMEAARKTVLQLVVVLEAAMAAPRAAATVALQFFRSPARSQEDAQVPLAENWELRMAVLPMGVFPMAGLAAASVS